MRCLFRFAGLTLALLLVAGSAVRAQDPTVTVGNVTSNVTSNITFDIGNSGLSANGGAGLHTDSSLPTGPFTGSTVPAGDPNLNGALFCIDLWHGQSPGANQNMNITNVASLQTFLTGNPNGMNVQVDSQLAAKLNYLGYVYETVYTQTGATGQNNESAAVQLAIWGLIDTGPKGFSASGISNSSALSDYNNILTLLSGTASTVEGISLLGFGAAGTMGFNAVIYQIPDQTPVGNNNGQDLLTWTPVPEPSSMAIAGLGALGLVGYGLRRRKSS